MECEMVEKEVDGWEGGEGLMDGSVKIPIDDWIVQGRREMRERRE